MELVTVLYLSCGQLCFAELLSWHSSIVLKIHFGSWVCFSVNQLPIHCINLSSLFYIKVSSLAKQGSIGYFQTCCLSCVGRIPSCGQGAAERLLTKGRWGKKRGKLKCEVAITTAEAAATFKGVGITLKISRTMHKQGGTKGFVIISSQEKSFQGGSPPFLPSRVQGGRW